MRNIGANKSRICIALPGRPGAVTSGDFRESGYCGFACATIRLIVCPPYTILSGAQTRWD